jgi:hypothetical protein
MEKKEKPKEKINIVLEVQDSVIDGNVFFDLLTKPKPKEKKEK